MVAGGGSPQRIYSDGAHTDNPYEKPRLKIEPTSIRVESSRSPSPTESVSSTEQPTGSRSPMALPPGLTALPHAIKAF